MEVTYSWVLRTPETKNRQKPQNKGLLTRLIKRETGFEFYTLKLIIDVKKVMENGKDEYLFRIKQRIRILLNLININTLT